MTRLQVPSNHFLYWLDSWVSVSGRPGILAKDLYFDQRPSYSATISGGSCYYNINLKCIHICRTKYKKLIIFNPNICKNNISSEINEIKQIRNLLELCICMDTKIFFFLITHTFTKERFYTDFQLAFLNQF